MVGQLSAKRRLQLLALPPAKRKRISGQFARKVRVNTRRRLKQQKSLNGQPWKKRKGKSRKKMLRGLSKKLVARGDSKGATVTFNRHQIGQVARAHQEGHTETMTARKMEKIHGQPDYEAPATRAQAKALKAEGFKQRKKSGKGYKNATIKDITQTMTIGQAGIVLRLMRDKDAASSWQIPLPARSFLGATEKEISDMANTVFDQTINAKN